MKITVFAIDNPRRMYTANLRDWLNPDLCTINVEVPYIGGTDTIDKANYAICLDETFEERR